MRSADAECSSFSNHALLPPCPTLVYDTDSPGRATTTHQERAGSRQARQRPHRQQAQQHATVARASVSRLVADARRLIAARGQVEADEARALLSTMWTIRAFEERLAELVANKTLAGLVHVGIGQEATAAGVCAVLHEDDYIYTGHRPDGPFIAKGADLGRMMAELAGRETGYCHGKGGHMHLVA